MNRNISKNKDIVITPRRSFISNLFIILGFITPFPIFINAEDLSLFLFEFDYNSITTQILEGTAVPIGVFSLIIYIFAVLLRTRSLGYIIRYGFSQNYLTFLTGCIIFYPACFVVNPVHIIIMGVTMHYTQYLYLTNYVYKSRVEAQNQGDKFISKSIFYFILIILFYSLIMTFLSSFAKSSGNNFFQELIFIPILGQMLHFYLDSQIWKFSEKHNREHTLKYLNRIIN